MKIRLLVTLILALPLFAGQQDNQKVEGTSQDIQWGQHWAGPKIENSEALKDKVVLLVIWGG